MKKCRWENIKILINKSKKIFITIENVGMINIVIFTIYK